MYWSTLYTHVYVLNVQVYSIHMYTCMYVMNVYTGLLCTYTHTTGYYRGCIGMCNIDTAEAVMTNDAQTSCNVGGGLFQSQ